MNWLKRLIRKWKADVRREWARVPPPEWAAKRGTGREYW